jgi:hypothetical protein
VNGRWEGNEKGPLCGTDTLFPVYEPVDETESWKLADVNFHGMPCQSQNLVGAVPVHYSVKIADWDINPLMAGEQFAFKMMAQVRMETSSFA